MTENTAYESFEMVGAFADFERKGAMRFMAGSKTVLAQIEWQTMEHSMGVTEMLRKPFWESGLRPSGVLRGRKTWRMGWRKLEYRLSGMWMRLKVPSYF